ncbi:MAG: hypothetical protein QM731_10630 [Chitinophagaceae bacterium]
MAKRIRKPADNQGELLLIYEAIKTLLVAYANKDYTPREEGAINLYELYYKNDLRLGSTTVVKPCLGGVLPREKYVSFYLSVLQVAPDLEEQLAPDLLKLKKKHNFFHIRKADATVLTHIKDALQTGDQFYQSKAC